MNKLKILMLKIYWPWIADIPSAICISANLYFYYSKQHYWASTSRYLHYACYLYCIFRLSSCYFLDLGRRLVIKIRCSRLCGFRCRTRSWWNMWFSWNNNNRSKIRSFSRQAEHRSNESIIRTRWWKCDA